MGRRPKKDVQYDAAVMEGALAVQQEAEMTIQKADELYLQGQEYDRFEIEHKTKKLLQFAKDSIIEAGAYLIVLKAHEGYGNFGFICQSIGIEPRTAQRYMKLARIFGKYDNLSHLPMAKMNALDVLSDDVLEKIDNGDGVSGITFEGVQAMPTPQLREEVKRVQEELEKERQEHTKQLEAVEKVVRQKESKISDLEMAVAGREPPTKEQLAQARLDELRKTLALSLASANEEVRLCQKAVADAQKIEGVTVMQLEDFSERSSELFSLLDDNYRQFCEDMEYIRPARGEA